MLNCNGVPRVNHFELPECVKHPLVHGQGFIRPIKQEVHQAGVDITAAACRPQRLSGHQSVAHCYDQGVCCFASYAAHSLGLSHSAIVLTRRAFCRNFLLARVSLRPEQDEGDDCRYSTAHESANCGRDC